MATSDGSGTEKVGFGRVREFPKFENSGSGISDIKKIGSAGNWNLGYRVFSGLI